MAENAQNKVLIVNPNSTEAVTQSIRDAVAPIFGEHSWDFECLTLADGPPGIESQEDADVVVAPLCELISRREAEYDAFIIACFGDPGLNAVRSVVGKPVFGIAESAYSIALDQGRRFGVIAILENSVVRHRRYIDELGLTTHYTNSVPIGVRVADLQGDRVLEKMVETGRRLVDDLDSNVVILGCAGMAAYRQQLETALGVPVIDPCQAACLDAIHRIGENNH